MPFSEIRQFFLNSHTSKEEGEGVSNYAHYLPLSVMSLYKICRNKISVYGKYGHEMVENVPELPS